MGSGMCDLGTVRPILVTHIIENWLIDDISRSHAVPMHITFSIILLSRLSVLARIRAKIKINKENK